MAGKVNDLLLLGVILLEEDDFITLDLEKLYRLNYFLYVEDNIIKFGQVSTITCHTNISFYFGNRIPKSSLLFFDDVVFKYEFTSG